MQQGECQRHAANNNRSGVETRRWRQRQTMGRRLLELDQPGWLRPEQKGMQFWRSLRLGGAGFSLAWLLSMV